MRRSTRGFGRPCNLKPVLKALYRSLALYPKGFSYIEYAAKNYPAQPWMLYSGNRGDIHFVDSYTCVVSTEDRAR